MLNALAGGWQLGGMLRTSSGFPLTVTSGVDRSNTAHGYDRPNAVAGVSPDLDEPSASAWFNVAAFQMNALGTFGNLGRATLTGPGVFTIDFSALKNFNFGRGKSIQLRIEAFNLLNTPNFADPNTNLAQSNWNAAGNNSIPTPGSGAFGTINSTRGTVPMRQMQFALKFVFWYPPIDPGSGTKSLPGLSGLLDRWRRHARPLSMITVKGSQLGSRKRAMNSTSARGAPIRICITRNTSVVFAYGRCYRRQVRVSHCRSPWQRSL